MNVTVTKFTDEAENPFYEEEDCHCHPCITLDSRTGVLNAENEWDYYPNEVRCGHMRLYPCDWLTVDELNHLLADLCPLAQQVLDGYRIVWDGVNYVGKFNHDAQSADNMIRQRCEETFGRQCHIIQ